MKAMNQLWNRKVSTYKEGKAQDYWDGWLDRVTRKRNHQMRDGINKTAKLIIDHCLRYGIGTLVLGWNLGFKSNVDMGSVNNQKFVQMPLGKLKERLKQLCDLHQIRYVETEESYTSKSSYLDGDSRNFGFWILDFRLGGNLKKTKPRVQLANSQSKIQNLKSKIGTARNLGIDLARLGRRCLTTVAFAKRVPCTELGFGFYLNLLCPQNLRAYSLESVNGVPCRLGCGGIESIVDLAIADDERAALQGAAKAVRQNINLAQDILAGGRNPT